MLTHNDNDADQDVPSQVQVRSRTMSPARPRTATPPRPDDEVDGNVQTATPTRERETVTRLETVVRNLIIDGAAERVVDAAFARVEAAREAADRADLKREQIANMRASVKREEDAAANTAAVRAGAAAEEKFRTSALTVTVECGPIVMKFTPERFGEDVQRHTCYTAITAALRVLSLAVTDAAKAARAAALHGRPPTPVDYGKVAAAVAYECRLAINRDSTMSVDVTAR